MKKGFTLIELLAVIVILAILAFITTPIVLSIISGTKDTTMVQSAKFYIMAVENAILAENVRFNGGFNPTYCNVDFNGDVRCDGKSDAISVEITGNSPISGLIEYDNGKVTNVRLDFGADTIIMDKNNDLTIKKNPEYETGKICKPALYLTTGKEPTGNFLSGEEYICWVNEDDAYTFFVLSASDNDVSLIMERNINSDGTIALKPIEQANAGTGIYSLMAWVSNYDYGCGGASDCWSKNNKGPITALNFLNKATSNWTNISKLNYSYTDENGKYATTFTGRARFATLAELKAIGCTSEAGTCPLWLANYLDDRYNKYTGKGHATIDGMNGYWTAATAGTSSAQVMASTGRIDNSPGYKEERGVRPVITVPKSSIAQ